MMRKAKIKADEMGTLNNSIMDGHRNVVGFLGEEVALDVLGGTASNTFNYDIIDAKLRTVDVKTKLTTVPPLENYDCSVAAYNTTQECDCYAFVRILKTKPVAWFLGYIKKEDYYNKATFMKKGEVDPSNNFTVRADCYNLKISELDSIPEIYYG
jgi:hypothetical protein